jgi:predicted AAA+ superfamily ATPase
MFRLIDIDVMNVIGSYDLARDASGKPLPTFLHRAQGRFAAAQSFTRTGRKAKRGAAATGAPPMMTKHEDHLGRLGEAGAISAAEASGANIARPKTGRRSAFERIAAALERLSGPEPETPLFDAADAFVFIPTPVALQPVPRVNRVAMELLCGIDQARDILFDNTSRFAKGFAANNALLWGARGMGKSSLVKAVHAEINSRLEGTAGFAPLKIVEIHREDIGALPALMNILRNAPYRFLIFCDDLSFDAADTSYKSLKAVLEGGIEGRPQNVLFYATSNRRHILSREMVENETGTAINPGETVEEKVSLSDRFGLWLGFHACSQDDYLAMVEGYAHHFGLDLPRAELERESLEWSITRGSRSGRTAWQYIQDLAGRLGKTSMG